MVSATAAAMLVQAARPPLRKASMTDKGVADLKTQVLNDLLATVGRNQDRQAFQRLFEHFAPRLKSYVMRLGTAADQAEEITQEVMVNVWRRADRYDRTLAAASTWIFTIARNVRIDFLRKARHPEPDPNDPLFAPNPVAAPHEALSSLQDAKLLREAIDQLPEDQQTVLKMAFFEDKTHGAIAEALEIPLGTVKSRIRLAMGRMRSELGDKI
jgi:RNA polymerase sigma factor (sigma-70 family)